MTSKLIQVQLTILILAKPWAKCNIQLDNLTGTLMYLLVYGTSFTALSCGAWKCGVSLFMCSKCPKSRSKPLNFHRYDQKRVVTKAGGRGKGTGGALNWAHFFHCIFSCVLVYMYKKQYIYHHSKNLCQMDFYFLLFFFDIFKCSFVLCGVGFWVLFFYSDCFGLVLVGERWLIGGVWW